MTADIVIRDARLLDGTSTDIAVAAGRIVAMGEKLPAAALTIEAKGGLVLPPFVNAHLHLCKVWTLPMMSEAALAAYHGAGMREALSAIDLSSQVKQSYAASWIQKNARRAVALAALHGNLHIRAFADVDSKAKLEAVAALIAVREEFRGIVDLQVVAFAQDGILREPGAAELMHAAMELGADVVGGIPWIEADDTAMQAHVDICFDLAKKFDADISMLLDDAGDPKLRTLEMMAKTALVRGWQGRCVAHHCRAMALYPDAAMPALIDLLRRADIAMVSNPHTGPLHMRVPELLAAGIPLCLGQDDISDAYYPFGRNNMLEVAFLAAHLLWMMTRAKMETLIDMVTVLPAQALHVQDYGIAVGHPANLLVLGEPDIVEALRVHAAPQAVISHGRLVDVGQMRALAAGGNPPDGRFARSLPAGV